MRFLILLFISINCFSQVKQTYNITHQVVFDGNSLSNKDGTNTDQKYKFPLSTNDSLYSKGKVFAYQCYADSGKSTTQLIADFPTKIAPILRKGDIVFIWEITNDIHYDLTGQQAYDNIITYCGLVRALGCKVVVGTYIYRDATGDNATVNSRGVDCNNLLIANNLTDFDGLVRFDLNSNFNTLAGCSNTTYYTTDKLHLSNTGYALCAKIAYPVIQSLIN